MAIQLPGQVLAAVYDRLNQSAEDAGMRARRRELIAEADGYTLEIGAGTGLNVEHYRPGVERLVLTESEPHMAKKLRARLRGMGREAEVIDTAGLPFASTSFDTVVATLVLCTVPDPAKTLEEVHRVLRPGGRLLFLAHVCSTEPRVARRQDVVRPVYRFVGRGCHPNRPTLETLDASPLSVERVVRERVEKAPSTVREIIVGVARRLP